MRYTKVISSAWLWVTICLLILQPEWVSAHQTTVKELVGKLPSTMSVHQGVMTIKYPLPIPDVMQSFLPELGLAYSSAQEQFNSVLGLGWALDGVSVIIRCPQFLDLDGKTRGVQFNDEDSFCLDGSRLIPLSPSSNEFRTEVDSYQKIVAHGRRGKGPAYFVVYSKDNKIRTYGENDNARHLLTAFDSTVYSWYLNEVNDYTDRRVKLSYTSVDNFPLLNWIKCGSYQVKFNYENRTDIPTTYMNGHRFFSLSSRLLNISVYSNRGNVAKTIHLKYRQVKSQQASALSSIQLCSRGYCVRPEQISYTNESDVLKLKKEILVVDNFGYTSTKAWQTEHPRIVIDINNDGLKDIVGFYNDGVYLSLNTGNGTFGAVNKIRSDFSHNSGYRVDNNPRYVLDINGDGLADLIGFRSSGVQVALNKGNSHFGKLNTWSFKFKHWSTYHYLKFLQDMNNDGLPDIVELDDTEVIVSLNTGKSFLPSTAWLKNYFTYSNGWPNTHNYPRYLVDVNGDGLVDLVGFGAKGILVSLNTGKQLLSPTYWSAHYGFNEGYRYQIHRRFVIDINGDGLPDIVAISHDKVQVSLNTGFKFNQKSIWHGSDFTHSVGWSDSNEPRYLKDMNADGFPDLIGFSKNGIYVALNSGTGFGTKIKWLDKSFGYEAASGSWSNTINFPRHITDVTGDGVLDIIGFGRAGTFVSTNPNVVHRLVKTIDGLGIEKIIRYSSTVKASTYSNGNKNSSYPNPIINTGNVVVVGLSESNGIGGFNTSVFRYEDARINLRGRGRLGFRLVIIEKNDRREEIYQTFHQMFPMVGLLTNISKYINSSLHSQENIIYSTKNGYNNFINLITLTESFKIQNELNNELAYTESILFERIDRYGNVGRTTKKIKNGQHKFDEIVIRLYHTNKEKWFINKMNSITKIFENQNDKITRQVTFHHNDEIRRIIEKINEPNNLNARKTLYKYDRFGNLVLETNAPLFNHKNVNSQQRIVAQFYDMEGINLISKINNVGHQKNYSYDQYDNIVSQIDSNGLKTEWVYDSMDRKINETRPNGIQLFWKYMFINSLIPHSIYKVILKESGKPEKIHIFDSLNRLLKLITEGVLNEKIQENFIYNGNGQIIQQSLPCSLKALPKWIVFEFDQVGRMILRKTPFSHTQSVFVRTVYLPMRINTIDEKGAVTSYIKSIIGQTVEVISANNDSTKYGYNSNGYLENITDCLGNTIKIKYDVFGNKIKMSDPDMGTWFYAYNVYGELIYQKDANNNEIKQKFDSIGRIVWRQEKEGISEWLYDTEYNGTLTKHFKNNFTRSYKYDKYGKPTSVSTMVESDTYDVQTIYDKYSRIIHQVYPGDVTIYHCNDKKGYLKSVQSVPCHNSALTGDYWQALQYNSDGQVVKERHGNGLITESVYDEGRHLMSIKTQNNVGQIIRHFKYRYDISGNLVNREDFNIGVGETTIEKFVYDKLNRLIHVHISLSNQSKSYSRLSEDWEYNSIGNIVRYSGIGGHHYEYDAKRPHAVIKAGPNSYQYDENGNMIAKNNFAVTWNSFNKIDSIKKDKETLSKFHYDPDRQKYMETVGNKKTVYIGKMYENIKEQIRVEGKLDKFIEKNKYYIYALGKPVAMFSSSEKVIHLHADHLGSIDTLTSNTGKVMESRRFNAFGKLRPKNWLTFQRCNDYNQTIPTVLDRGYTGHRHLESIDIIDMNGRVYDPLIGRFLSPDPNIQDLFNPQNLNRYSYVINNPLKYNDPSGYFFQFLGNLIKAIWRPVLAIVVSAVTVGLAAPFAAGLVASIGLSGTSAAIVGGALSGSVGGAAGGFVLTGTPKGALQGALGGALTGGIAGGFGDVWNMNRVVSESISGGVMSEVQGGDFIEGAVIAGIASGSRLAYNKYVGYDVTWKPGGSAVQKTYTSPPVKDANNIGIQGGSPTQFLHEGGTVSKMLNLIPGLNAVAGLHDKFQISFGHSALRDWANIPGMFVAASSTVPALLDQTVIKHYFYQSIL